MMIHVSIRCFTQDIYDIAALPPQLLIKSAASVHAENSQKVLTRPLHRKKVGVYEICWPITVNLLINYHLTEH